MTALHQGVVDNITGVVQPPAVEGFSNFVGTKMTTANLQRLAHYAERCRRRHDELQYLNGATTGLVTANTITTEWNYNNNVAWYPANVGAAITVNGTSGTVTINNCIITDTANFTAANFTCGNGWIIQGANGNHWQYTTPVTVPKHLEKERKNHRGVVIRSNHSERQFDNCTRAEMLALQLLRKMVSPEEFRRYLRHGHVNVRGASGLIYQIGRQRGIHVWERGVRIAGLCVHLQHGLNTPPTDHVVGKMLIVECDEPDIWKRSNVTWYTDRRHEIAGPKAKTSGLMFGGAAVNIINERAAATG